MWKLKFEGKEVFCVLENRPNIDIEETEMIDKHGNHYWVPGKANWLPLKITLPAGGTLWRRCKDVKLVMFDKERELEEWTLKNSRTTTVKGDNVIEINFSGCEYKNHLAG